MRAIAELLAVLFRLSIASCIFLAFGWPYLVSPDPSSEAFRVLATGSLVTLLASLAGLVVSRITSRPGDAQGEG